MMTFALLESLAVTALLIALASILPSAWLRDGFAQKGLVSIAVFALTAIIFQKLLDDFPAPPVLLFAMLMPILIITLILYASRSQPRLHNVLLGIQDRIPIMLFIYVPIGLVSLLVVAYQNLF